MPRPVALHLVSTSYAGSTLLGLALGAHSRSAFLGEPAKLLDRSGDGWRHRSYCAICSATQETECSIWSEERVARFRAAPHDLDSIVSAPLGDPRVLIDGSKRLRWTRQRIAREAGTEHRFVHLVRSVEAYVASTRARNRGRGRVEYIADDWVERNRQIRKLLLEHPARYRTVRYEDFVAEPQATLSDLLPWLTLDDEPVAERIWDLRPHYVKSNPATTSHFAPTLLANEPKVNRTVHRENHRTIFLDEKWRTVLTDAELHRIYALPKVENEARLLRYEHPLDRPIPLAARVRARTVEPVARTARRMGRQLLGRSA